MSSEGSTDRGACSACAARDGAKRLYRVNGCSIVQCPACGTARAVDIQAFDPQAYYTGDYFNGGHADGYADYRGSRDVLIAEFARTARFLASKMRPHGKPRLLELGSAYGYFLEAAEAQGFEAHGVEIAQAPVDDCIARGLQRVHAGVLTEPLAQRIGEIDAVVLLDVVEHLDDPYGVLELACRRLSPGGALLLTTGDFGSLFARASGRRWRLMTPPQHLWFFTAPGMRALARRLGLVCESIDHPGKRVPLGLMAYQAARGLGIRFEAPRAWNALALPVNLFDAMRVVMRKPPTT
jgi:SAM-dependent methyltransferase